MLRCKIKCCCPVYCKLNEPYNIKVQLLLSFKNHDIFCIHANGLPCCIFSSGKQICSVFFKNKFCFFILMIQYKEIAVFSFESFGCFHSFRCFQYRMNSFFLQDIFSTYLKAFKKNFPQSVAAFLIQLVLAFVFVFNAIFWGEQNTVPGNICMFLITLLLVVLAFSFLYTFPLLARFQNSLKQTLKNSVAIAVTNPKITLGLLAIQAVFIIACIAVPQAKIFMALLGFAFDAYCNSLLLTRLFSLYEDDQEAFPVLS